MVFFTCNHCGESLKKAAVEKHYNFKCRGAKKSISCMDCQKDFYGEEYVAHTKCITEAEKYSGKDYVPKEQRNSGQKKQESWMEIIRSIMDTKDLSPEIRNIFNKLKAGENVPRKKVKFVNFVSNSMRLRVNQVEQVWAILEEVLIKMKETSAAAAQQNKIESTPKETEKAVDSIDNQKTEADGGPEQAETTEKKKKAKKSKKRKVDKEVQNTIEEDEEEEILQMVEKTVKNDDASCEPKKKKHKKRDDAPVCEKEAEQESTVSTTTPDAFEWGLVMEYTVRKYADGISIDKLKRKVQRMYINKRGGSPLTDKEKQKFDKKYTKYIKKCNFKVEDGIVRIAEQVE